MKKVVPDGYTCPNCGAPVTTEICEFCGASTAIASKNADMKYPVIDCKEADIDGKGAWQAFYMGFIMLAFSIGMSTLFLKTTSGEGTLLVLFVSAIFSIIGVLMTIMSIKHTYKHIPVKIFGKRIYGTVWGYIDNKRSDGIIHGDLSDRSGGQIVKILVKEDGKDPFFLLYELMHDEQPYGINQKVSLRVYKGMYILEGIAD